jgi:hypothetical protein
MLKQIPFANAIAATAAVFYIVFWILAQVSPAIFRILWNANFLGADLATAYPPATDIQTSLVTLITMAVMGWVGGYIFVWFYNRWAK